MKQGDAVTATIEGQEPRKGKVVRVKKNGPKNEHPELIFVEHDDGKDPKAMYYAPAQLKS